MPYVNQKARQHLDNGIEPLSAGELNYLITQLLIRYLNEKEVVGYTELNEVTGVLENVKNEFDARVVGPYEREKMIQNGDVGYGDLVEKILPVRGRVSNDPTIN